MPVARGHASRFWGARVLPWERLLSHAHLHRSLDCSPPPAARVRHHVPGRQGAEGLPAPHGGGQEAGPPQRGHAAGALRRRGAGSSGWALEAGWGWGRRRHAALWPWRRAVAGASAARAKPSGAALAATHLCPPARPPAGALLLPPAVPRLLLLPAPRRARVQRAGGVHAREVCVGGRAAVRGWRGWGWRRERSTSEQTHALPHAAARQTHTLPHAATRRHAPAPCLHRASPLRPTSPRTPLLPCARRLGVRVRGGHDPQHLQLRPLEDLGPRRPLPVRPARCCGGGWSACCKPCQSDSRATRRAEGCAALPAAGALGSSRLPPLCPPPCAMPAARTCSRSAWRRRSLA